MCSFRVSYLLLALTSIAQTARVSRNPDDEPNMQRDFAERFRPGKTITIGSYLDAGCTQRNDTGNISIEVVSNTPFLCLLINQSPLSETWVLQTWVEGGKRRRWMYNEGVTWENAPRCSIEHFEDSNRYMGAEKAETADLFLDSLYGGCNDATPLGFGHLKLGDVPLLKESDGPHFNSGLFAEDDETDSSGTGVTATTTGTNATGGKSGSSRSSAIGSICWVVLLCCCCWLPFTPSRVV
mmetsp:Transcript_35249/g.64453  ORF Transcript_35249/g.64453 Transcript_35249/m.64453 type:complete len:239 (+) Transcript_35249:57-773(+)